MSVGQYKTPKTTFKFSTPLTDNLKKLNLPLLITYGGKDHSAPFDDYLRVEMIRQRKRNFSFRSCSGLEHNYFRLNPDGQPDYNNFNRDRAAVDWNKWLKID